MPYAERTTVTVSKSRDEIERIVARFGGSKQMWLRDDDNHRVTVAFERGGRAYRVAIPLPLRENHLRGKSRSSYSRGSLRTEAQVVAAVEQEERRLFRSLALYVKAILEAIESGIITADEALLPWAMLPSGRTVAETAIPQLQAHGDVDFRLALPEGGRDD